MMLIWLVVVCNEVCWLIFEKKGKSFVDFVFWVLCKKFVGICEKVYIWVFIMLRFFFDDVECFLFCFSDLLFWKFGVVVEFVCI